MRFGFCELLQNDRNELIHTHFDRITLSSMRLAEWYCVAIYWNPHHLHRI